MCYSASFVGFSTKQQKIKTPNSKNKKTILSTGLDISAGCLRFLITPKMPPRGTKFKRIIQWQTSIRLKLWCSVHQEKFIAEFSRNSNVFGELFLSENIDTFRCFILLSMLLVELKKVQINYDKELSREGRKKGSNVENYGAVLHALLASALIHWLDYPSISSANSCSSNTVTALDLLGQCPKLRQQCFWSKPSTWHWWL